MGDWQSFCRAELRFRHTHVPMHSTLQRAFWSPAYVSVRNAADPPGLSSLGEDPREPDVGPRGGGLQLDQERPRLGRVEPPRGIGRRHPGLVGHRGGGVLREDLLPQILQYEPGEPTGSTFHERIRHPAYPCRDVGGLILTYMGPGEPPLIPAFEFLVFPIIAGGAYLLLTVAPADMRAKVPPW